MRSGVAARPVGEALSGQPQRPPRPAGDRRPVPRPGRAGPEPGGSRRGGARASGRGRGVASRDRREGRRDGRGARVGGRAGGHDRATGRRGTAVGLRATASRPDTVEVRRDEVAGHRDPAPEHRRTEGVGRAVGRTAGMVGVAARPGTAACPGRWEEAQANRRMRGRGDVGRCDGPAGHRATWVAATGHGADRAHRVELTVATDRGRERRGRVRHDPALAGTPDRLGSCDPSAQRDRSARTGRHSPPTTGLPCPSAWRPV